MLHFNDITGFLLIGMILMECALDLFKVYKAISFHGSQDRETSVSGCYSKHNQVD